MLGDWNYKTHNTDTLIESRREQVRLQEELSMKEKFLRDSHIRSMHDMGEMKRAQELRVDEVSVQKSRENHETKQQLTFQLHEMQEQMNSMNDSGEFHEVESNNSGRMSHVSSQPASSRSVLSRDKRLPLDTWNQAGLQENVFGTQFSTFDSHRDQENENQFHKLQGRTLFARDDKQNQGTIPMLTFARRPSTMRSLLPVEVQQNSMVGHGTAIRQIP